MIEVYEGTLGGGKSYHAVKRALPYLASGGRVFSNVELVKEECESYVADFWGVGLNWEEQYHYLTASDIARLHEVVKGGTRECNVLCILDEIHLYHNARDWAQASRGLLQWLTQSRKLFVDIICITQHRNNLDKQWIRLVGKYWRFRDLRKWRMPGIGLRLPFVQCLSVELDQDGKTVLSKQFERFDNRIFRCYSSEQIFDGVAQGFAGAGLERVKLKKVKGKSMKGYIWIFVMIIAVIGVVFFWNRSKASSFLSRSTKFDSRSSSVSDSPSPPSPIERSRRRHVEDLPPPSPFVECPGWYACNGLVVGGFNVRERLTFSGEPDGITNGLPMYARVRGLSY